MRLTKRQACDMGLAGPGMPLKGGKRKKALQGTSTNKEDLFDALCERHGLSRPVHEYPFHPTRKWRFDYLFDGWLALEVQGGIFTNGRHTQGAALLKEHEKLNEAVICGYSVIFCTPDDIWKTGAIFPTIKRALDAKGEQP